MINLFVQRNYFCYLLCRSIIQVQLFFCNSGLSDKKVCERLFKDAGYNNNESLIKIVPLLIPIFIAIVIILPSFRIISTPPNLAMYFKINTLSNLLRLCA